MARIRSVKPELRTSLVVGAWPREVRYAWVLLWGYLDDHGRGLDDLRLLVADLFPLDRDVTERKLDGWLNLMVGPLCRYEVDGRRYLHSVNWTDHQRVSHPKDSRWPACGVHESRATDSGTIPEDSRKTSRQDRADFATSHAPADQGEGNREQGADETAPPSEPPRIDVEQICTALAAAVVANGARKPTITQTWRREARLLLDKDSRPLAEVLRVIEWATQDGFWKANILSVPTLREKYDRLLIQAKQASQQRQAVGSRQMPPGTHPHMAHLYEQS